MHWVYGYKAESLKVGYVEWGWKDIVMEWKVGVFGLYGLVDEFGEVGAYVGMVD